MKHVILCTYFIVLAMVCSGQVPLTVVGWNVEQGYKPEAEITWIEDRLTEIDRVDIWGLTEISREYVDEYTSAIEADEGSPFAAVVSEMTHGTDLMAVVYDADRFEKLWHAELVGFNYALSKNTRFQRPPLAVHFKDTVSGQHFVVMVNHLARGNEDHRHTQAERLQQWGSKQNIPIIAVGDYNFDWDVENGDSNHDEGYDLMTSGGFFAWLRPGTLIRTQCSPTNAGGCRYNSVLDFVFVANEAKQWQGVSEIMVKEGDFPDDDIKADHRPVMAKFILPLE